MKALLSALFLLGGSLAASPAISDGAPPASEQARKIQTLVNKAAALIDENGKAAFADKKDSEWWFGDEFLKVVQTKGSGWVDYVFPKPGQTQPSQKWSYVKAMTIDGKPVGAGFYP